MFASPRRTRRTTILLCTAALASLAIGAALDAEARGGGRSGAGAVSRAGSSAKRGKKDPKGQVAVDRLIHDTFRRNIVARSRYVSW